MPTWSGILREIQERTAQTGQPAIDEIRRKYLVQLGQHTGRNVILYAGHFTVPISADALPFVQILDEDLQGFMEVVAGLQGNDLDLILHSPGGSLEAAESIVCYLRSKFTNIRVIVPHLAQSAATIIACSADAIVMGKHSFLGPIDPQLLLQTPLGFRFLPAQSIVDQFARAKDECRNKDNFPAWAPMLPQYGPDLLVKSDNAIHLSRELVRQWLARYMFAGEPEQERNAKAEEISNWLGNHNAFRTHGKHIQRSELEKHRLNIVHLEIDQRLQDLVLSVYHATTHTFANSRCVKIIENNLGMGFFKIINPSLGQAPPLPAGPPMQTTQHRRGLFPLILDFLFGTKRGGKGQ